jgi:hypothetical protein
VLSPLSRIIDEIKAKSMLSCHGVSKAFAAPARTLGKNQFYAFVVWRRFKTFCRYGKSKNQFYAVVTWSFRKSSLELCLAFSSVTDKLSFTFTQEKEKSCQHSHAPKTSTRKEPPAQSCLNGGRAQAQQRCYPRFAVVACNAVTAPITESAATSRCSSHGSPPGRVGSTVSRILTSSRSGAIRKSFIRQWRARFKISDASCRAAQGPVGLL